MQVVFSQQCGVLDGLYFRLAKRSANLPATTGLNEAMGSLEYSGAPIVWAAGLHSGLTKMELVTDIRNIEMLIYEHSRLGATFTKSPCCTAIEVQRRHLAKSISFS